MRKAGGAVEDGDARIARMEKLTELRNRLIKSAIAVVIGMVVSCLLYEPIFDILVEPYKQVANESNTFTGDERLVQFDPLEGFSIRMKLAGYGGIALAMPVILWQIWRFVTPGLYDHERRYALPFIARALPTFPLGPRLASYPLPNARDVL